MASCATYVFNITSTNNVPGDYDAVRAYHKQMDCVCYENTDMGLYFISDPDGYWIEILPEQS